MKSKMIIAVLFICISLLSACEQGTHQVSQEIERNLDTIIGDKASIMVSSNPNDYIKNNPASYNNIVHKDAMALDYLVKELQTSDQNGLKEWIMAKACTDILKDKNPVKQWATGKEWLQQYELSRGGSSKTSNF